MNSSLKDALYNGILEFFEWNRQPQRTLTLS